MTEQTRSIRPGGIFYRKDGVVGPQRHAQQVVVERVRSPSPVIRPPTPRRGDTTPDASRRRFGTKRATKQLCDSTVVDANVSDGAVVPAEASASSEDAVVSSETSASSEDVAPTPDAVVADGAAALDVAKDTLLRAQALIAAKKEKIAKRTKLSQSQIDDMENVSKEFAENEIQRAHDEEKILNELREAKLSADAMVADLNSEHDKQSVLLIAAQAHAEDLQKQLEATTADIAAKDRASAEIQAEHARLLATYKDDLAKSNTELARLRVESENLRRESAIELNCVKTTLLQASAASVKYQADLVVAHETLRDTVQQKDRIIHELYDRCAQNSAEVSRLRTDLEAAKSGVAASTGDAVTSRARIASLQQAAEEQAVRHRRELDMLTADIATHTANETSLIDQLRVAKVLQSTTESNLKKEISELQKFVGLIGEIKTLVKN